MSPEHPGSLAEVIRGGLHFWPTAQELRLKRHSRSHDWLADNTRVYSWEVPLRELAMVRNLTVLEEESTAAPRLELKSRRARHLH